ncbi:hypothetical protein LTR70_006890 [Exophiala xenobiotica]|nr:hypothetical protein LTR70_006890 [Exophiala xenobiotica]
MWNDVKEFSLDRICRERSLIEQMLEIQDFQRARLKSFTWMKSLICLSADNTPTSATARSFAEHTTEGTVLHEVKANLFDKQQFQYVTISYPWHPAPYESGKRKNFRIRTIEGDEHPSVVRDTIMRRAVHYVQHHHLKGFWIDRQCLDQEDTEKHQIAMHSMDRLYAESPCSVGMLTTKVDHQWKLNALRALLDGSLFRGTGDETVVALPPSLELAGFWRVLKWFGRLVSDPWWRRCWIFQEEYCAGWKMFVLIPCEPCLQQNTPEFGTMRGEIETPAVELRTQLTVFALACQRDARLDAKQKHFVQRTILHKAERYQTSYQLGRHWGHTLSSIIIADLQRRRIKYPRDFLAISANCCTYGRRLDEKALEQHDGVSLGLSLFVQALLNGEILVNQKHTSRAFRRGFAAFFHQQIFNAVQPPMGMDTLTFLKRCRFTNVQLCQEGIATTGYLWRITDALDIGNAEARYQFPAHGSFTRSCDSLRTCLKQLAQRIASSHPSLASRLGRFISDMKARDNSTVRDEFMMAMAKEVARAWSERRRLVIGELPSHGTGCGLFVAPDLRDLPRHVFTSWHNASGSPFRDIQELVDKHVSLELDVEAEPSGRGLPRLRTKRWINGLYFFSQTAEQKVVFPWPDSFL